MSTRHNYGSHYENHQHAAELHDLAGHAHRTAAEDHGKQDHPSGHERSREALEHPQSAPRNMVQTNARATNEHGIAMFGHQDIATLAHQLWQERGCPEGSSQEDWFQAAEELRSRY